MKILSLKRWAIQFPNAILVAFFVLIIGLPLVDQLLELGLDTYVVAEKRHLAPPPIFQWNESVHFPQKYEAYFNDSFSFRALLIKINSYISRRAFGISAIPDVLIGKDGWLYLTSREYGSSLEDYMGLIDVDLGTLELIRNNLERRTKDLQDKGIQFLVVVAPDKQSIYPEYLLDHWRRNNRYLTRLDQIVQYLKVHSSVQVLDVRNSLLKEKREGNLPLYRKTDSHWNYFGAFIAYQEMMRSLSMVPYNKTDFEWKQQPFPSGDLAAMLAASDQYVEENEVTFSSFETNNISFVESENNYGTSLENTRLVAANKNKLPKKLLVFHDSFGQGLFPFLSLHFGESVFINSNFYSTVIVEKEKPDVVIFELVERFSISLAWKELDGL